MSDKIKGFKIYETYGVGIINPMALALNGWVRFYGQVLKRRCKIWVKGIIEDGSYVIGVDDGSEKTMPNWIAAPEKEIVRDFNGEGV